MNFARRSESPCIFTFIDPRVHIDPLSWREDVVTLAVLGVVGAALVLVALAAGFWFTKSRRRQEERFQRRNSIRQSLHSVRSLGSVHGGTFSDIAYRRKEPVSITFPLIPLYFHSLFSLHLKACHSFYQ